MVAHALAALIALTLLALRAEAFAPLRPMVRRGSLVCRSQFGGDEFARQAAAPVKTASSEPPQEDQPADEVKEEEEKSRRYSDAMVQKLRRETEALGGDPNKKSANPILIIFGVVGALAILTFATGQM